MITDDHQIAWIDEELGPCQSSRGQLRESIAIMQQALAIVTDNAEREAIIGAITYAERVLLEVELQLIGQSPVARFEANFAREGV
jgi:hypothetical protein